MSRPASTMFLLREGIIPALCTSIACLLATGCNGESSPEGGEAGAAGANPTTAGAPSTEEPETKGTLDVTIVGLPAGVKADVTVAGGPSKRSMSATATISLDLGAGDYSIMAEAVLVDGVVYEASASAESVTIAPGKEVSVTVTYTEEQKEPPTLDPSGIRILGPDPGGYFGWDVDIDGDVAIVGAPNDDDSNMGAAYVFRRVDDTWQQEARLALATIEERLFSWFGSSVAIEGNTAVVGALGANDDAGGVYVYEYDGETWSSGVELTCKPPRPEGSKAERGRSVAISGDTIAASASGFLGFVCLFVRDAGSWVEQEVIQPEAYKSDIGLDLSLVGDSVAWTTSSPAFFYKRNGMWNGGALEQTKDDKAWPPHAVSHDADRLLLGAPSYPVGDVLAGRAVLSSLSEAFTPIVLTPEEPVAGQRFGETVALAEDWVLVGAPTSENDPPDGRVYIFDRTGKEREILEATDPEEDLGFGQALAVAGNTALIGAWRHHTGRQIDTGAVYFFDLE